MTTRIYRLDEYELDVTDRLDAVASLIREFKADKSSDECQAAAIAAERELRKVLSNFEGGG